MQNAQDVLRIEAFTILTSSSRQYIISYNFNEFKVSNQDTVLHDNHDNHGC